MNAISGPELEVAPLREQEGFSAHERRVLLLAPSGNDARLTARFLCEAGFIVEECRSVAEICSQMQGGCGVIILAEEALLPRSVGSLLETFARQPSWSDIPLIMITSGGEAVQG